MVNVNKELKETGIVNLKPIPSNMIDEVWSFLYTKSTYPGHVNGRENSSFTHYGVNERNRAYSQDRTIPVAKEIVKSYPYYSEELMRSLSPLVH